MSIDDELDIGSIDLDSLREYDENIRAGRELHQSEDSNDDPNAIIDNFMNSSEIDDDTNITRNKYRPRVYAFDAGEHRVDNTNNENLLEATKEKLGKLSVANGFKPLSFFYPDSTAPTIAEIQDETKLIQEQKVNEKTYINTVSTYQIMIIGESGVGKTTLIRKYLDMDLKQLPIFCSTGIDYIKKEIDIDNKHIRLLYVDTSGQRRFIDYLLEYVEFCNQIIMVIDLSDESTLNYIQIWFDLLLEEFPEKLKSLFPIIIIGNKTDLPRELHRRDIKRCIPLKSDQYIYLECNMNIVQSIHKVMNISLNKVLSKKM